MTRIVVKLGGAVARDAVSYPCALAEQGHEVCIVHGAGPQISLEMARRGIEVSFVNGRRVTTPEALAVVREVLERVNGELVRAVGDKAVGLMGDEIGLEAEQVAELGLVGNPLPSAPAAVVEALSFGKVPVVAPLARGPLNVNADETAAMLAVGIGAERVHFVTDVPGLLIGDEVVASIHADEAERLLAGGELRGGIIPKLTAALHAVRQGVVAEIGETAVIA
ncbi:MAG: acetylglutamate kinase [Gaiellaceae bacterium]